MERLALGSLNLDLQVMHKATTGFFDEPVVVSHDQISLQGVQRPKVYHLADYPRSAYRCQT